MAGRGWLLEKGCRDRQAAHMMLSLLSEIVLVLLSASIKEPGFSWREMCKRQRRRHLCQRAQRSQGLAPLFLLGWT